MRLVLLPLVPLLTVNSTAWATNPAWVRLDKRLIQQVTTVLNASPAAAARYFGRHLRQVHNLGFGWQAKEGAVAGGYISIQATFYYHHDTLVSYAVYPQLPTKSGLRNRYRAWYAPRFQLDSTGVHPWYYQPARVCKPLAADPPVASSLLATAALEAYMSPEAGLAYGYRGGYGLTLLPNRKRFLTLQATLTPEQVWLLMHALNPASRLTAIEYYLLHKQLFANQRPIEQWMEIVFQELPEVESLNGCIGGQYNARALVASFTASN